MTRLKNVFYKGKQLYATSENHALWCSQMKKLVGGFNFAGHSRVLHQQRNGSHHYPGEQVNNRQH